MLRGENACFRHFCGKSAIASHAGKIGLRVHPVVITTLAKGMIAVGALGLVLLSVLEFVRALRALD